MYAPKDDEYSDEVKASIVMTDISDDKKVEMVIEGEKYDKIEPLGNIYNEDDRDSVPVVFYKTYKSEDDDDEEEG